MGRIIAIMSGKGGVGKSTLSAALAECYARMGKKVALLDGDVGLRCADLMLGMQDKVVFDLGDVVEERCGLDQALLSHPDYPFLLLLAAPQMMKPSDVKAKKIRKIVDILAARMDVVILDAPAGIGRGLKNLLNEQAMSLIVATPDDVSIRDAERLSSLLFDKGEMHSELVLNRVDRHMVKMGDMLPPAQIARMLDLRLMGIIPESRAVYRALLSHQTALRCADRAVVSALERTARRLLGQDVPLPSYKKSIFRKKPRGGGDVLR